MIRKHIFKQVQESKQTYNIDIGNTKKMRRFVIRELVTNAAKINK